MMIDNDMAGPEIKQPALEAFNRQKVAESRILGVAFDFDDTLVRLPIEWQQVMADYYVRQIYGEHLGGREREREIMRVRQRILDTSGTPLREFMYELQQMVREQALMVVQSVDQYRTGFDLLWRETTCDLNTPADLVEGALPLVRNLVERSIDVFVVSGGDWEHKAGLMGRLGLAPYIPANHVFGDDDPRFHQAFSKAAALRYIRSMLQRKHGIAATSNVPILAMIGDGERDMQAAQSVAGVLAIGFNQRQRADLCIHGAAFPVEALTDLLAGCTGEQ